MKRIVTAFSLMTIFSTNVFAAVSEQNNLESKSIVCTVEFNDYDIVNEKLVLSSRKEVLHVMAKFTQFSDWGTQFVAADTFKLNLHGDVPGGVGLRAASPWHNPVTNKYEEDKIEITLADAYKFTMASAESRACRSDSECLEMGPLQNTYIGTIGADGKSIKLAVNEKDISYAGLLRCELRKTPLSLYFSKGKTLSSEITK